MNKPS